MTRRICATDKSAEKYYLPDLPPHSDQTSLDQEKTRSYWLKINILNVT